MPGPVLGGPSPRTGLILLGLSAVLAASSCSKEPTLPRHPHLAPQTELTFAPVESDTTSVRVHLFWNGFDGDGEVIRFRYALDGDSLAPVIRWKTTTAKDTILLFPVDPPTEYKVHVFKVAAEDNEGFIDPTPASRAFSAKTIPPNSRIESGPPAFNPQVGPNFTFTWSGIDPDGGTNGDPASVDSFQYLLLRIGSVADSTAQPAHDPLPPFSQDDYTALIRAATGDALPTLWTSPDGLTRRLDDWKWVGIRGLERRFVSIPIGEYVFAERAVDIAGAREKDLAFVRNIRHFTVVNPATHREVMPSLAICSSILNHCVVGTGSQVFLHQPIGVFEGEALSFSWSATATAYGGVIAGYTYALDDTSSFPALDLRQTGATFGPTQLMPGDHFLYVRVVDGDANTTTLRLPLRIVHPAFKDPGALRSILFVDDSLVRLGNDSAPTDQTETDWWTLGPGGAGPLFSLGVPYTEWDAYERGIGTVEGRMPPMVTDLAPYSTLVWTTDGENGGSVQTALFKATALGYSSDLQSYLRAGGTLILIGWSLAQGSSGISNLTFKPNGPAPDGICAAFPPGSREYRETIFPRMYMGIDNSVQSRAGVRSQGAADFVRALPTTFGVSLGFDTARVDTGNVSFGVQYPQPGPSFKWNTNSSPPPPNPDLYLWPGVAGIEGWIMARDFGCQPIQNFAMERPGEPIAQVIYTYHGVRMGVSQDGPPSPREGLACATLMQSHDLATGVGLYRPTAAIGRIAFFTFPLYFLKDADAVDIMRKSFAYVNASPTLP